MKRFVFWLLLLAGCATPPPATLTCAQAKCPVCASNRDFGCVNVDITPTTPHVTRNGVTYYFCSEDCKAEFEKTADKYVKH